MINVLKSVRHESYQEKISWSESVLMRGKTNLRVSKNGNYELLISLSVEPGKQVVRPVE